MTYVSHIFFLFLLFQISYFWTWILAILKLPVLICLLVFISSIPMTAAMSAEMPFPDITFHAFNKFISKNFTAEISSSTVLLVWFTMTENSDLLNLHAHQKHPRCTGEIKQSSSGWIRALAQSLGDRFQDKISTLLMDTELPETPNNHDIASSLAVKLDKLMEVLNLSPFSKTGKLK